MIKPSAVNVIAYNFLHEVLTLQSSRIGATLPDYDHKVPENRPNDLPRYIENIYVKVLKNGKNIAPKWSKNIKPIARILYTINSPSPTQIKVYWLVVAKTANKLCLQRSVSSVSRKWRLPLPL